MRLEKWREAGTWSVISFEASESGRRILPTVRARPAHQRTGRVEVKGKFVGGFFCRGTYR